MMGYGGFGMGYGGWLMVFFGLLVVAGLVVLIVWAVNRPWGAGEPLRVPQDPETVLKLRLARGEITPAEYEDRIQHLRD